MKHYTLVLLVALAFVLGGCGNGDDGNNGSGNNGETDAGMVDAGDVGDMDDTGSADTGPDDTGTTDTGDDTGMDAGSDAEQPQPCAADERVEAGECVACAPGTTNEAGDDPAGADTDCDAILCAENERVQDNACVACPAGEVSDAGADASGDDTQCVAPDACFDVLGIDCDAYQEAYLKTDVQDAVAKFGSAVAMSDDGQTLFVGAPNFNPGTEPGGAVFVFGRSGATWTQLARLRPSEGGNFGTGLDIDGNILAVAANGSGRVHLYTGSSGTWTEEDVVSASNYESGDRFGNSIALSGDTLVVGARLEKSETSSAAPDPNDNSESGIGAVYVFERDANGWAETLYLKPPNPRFMGEFGSGVDIEGDTMVVGSSGEASGATGIDGDMMDDSKIVSGAVFVYGRSGGTWSLEHYIKASNTDAGDKFGYAVELSGDRLAVGATFEKSTATGVGGDQSINSEIYGAVYVFTRANDTWSQEAYIKSIHPPSRADLFGSSLAFDASGELLAVGAINEDGGGLGFEADPDATPAIEDSGAVYLYERDALGDWSPVAYIKAPNAGEAHYFGHAVALSRSGGHLAIGANEEDGGAIGINGDMSDQSADRSGAVYVNRLVP